MTMNASENLRKLHELTEGVHPEAYLCPAGVLTIGIGHTEQKKHPFTKDSKGTEEQIAAAWRDDIAEAEAAAAAAAKPDPQIELLTEIRDLMKNNAAK